MGKKISAAVLHKVGDVRIDSVDMPETPLENIAALFEAMNKYRKD